MKAYVITIEDIEESKISARRCIESAEKFGIEVKPFLAMTPRNCNPIEELNKHNIPSIGFCERWSRHPNVMCCFLSHYYLWLRCSIDKQPYLILEHDAVFVDSFSSYINFRGVLNLGKPSYGNYKIPPFLGVNKLTSKEYFPGAHAYLIKPYASEQLINRAKIDASPVDVFLHNDRFNFLEELYPWVVEARDSFTTVQNINGCIAKHNYAKKPEQYSIL